MMTKSKIPVPGTAYPKLIAIIRAYYILSTSQKATESGLLSSASILKDNVSKNNRFLIEVGIFKAGADHKLTELGIKLGKAIQENNQSEISNIWAVIVERNQVFQDVLNIVRLHESIDRQELKHSIAKVMKLPPTFRGVHVIAQTIVDILNAAHAIILRKKGSETTIALNTGKPLFINNKIIVELGEIASADFDLSKLIRLCEELNSAFNNNNFFSVVMLARAILDHVPPIFSGLKTFAEVSSNYGGKSLKKSFQNLQNSLRNIADAHLHEPIRRKESLPNDTQIDFRNDMDILLSEIVRIMKQQ